MELVPAHYLHASGSFNMFDLQTGILMSGDNVERFLDWFDALEVGLTGQKLRG